MMPDQAIPNSPQCPPGRSIWSSRTGSAGRLPRASQAKRRRSARTQTSNLGWSCFAGGHSPTTMSPSRTSKPPVPPHTAAVIDVAHEGIVLTHIIISPSNGDRTRRPPCLPRPQESARGTGDENQRAQERQQCPSKNCFHRCLPPSGADAGASLPVPPPRLKPAKDVPGSEHSSFPCKNWNSLMNGVPGVCRPLQRALPRM